MSSPLPDLLKSLTDSRRSPEISTFDVVNSLFHTAVLRIPSINGAGRRSQGKRFPKNSLAATRRRT